MYNIPYFKEKDGEVVLRFMQQHPFALLIGCANGFPVATQVPLLLEARDGKLFLQGHIMCHTDHHKAFLENPNALCVFTGAHSYVSASWYSDPQAASTWNYMSVHAKGELKFLDEEALIQLLQKTTAHFEKSEHSPAAFEKLPQDYVRHHAKAIVAFEVEVKELENIFKLSQNRDKQSYNNIIDQLSNSDAAAAQVAEEMKKRTSQLFK